MSVVLDRFASLDLDEAEELLCRASLAVWTRRRIGLEMAPLHYEWCSLRMGSHRLAVVAPREHSKTETFTVNGTAWESIYTPGLWTYAFSQTADQAKLILQRIIAAVDMAAPWMTEGMRWQNSLGCQFANYSMVSVAGAGKGVRGAHPDVIIGDDVLEEGSSLTSLQRKRVERWWLGAVSGMCHPGTQRTIGKGDLARSVTLAPTRVFLVGTPFHHADLLMNMKKNPVYKFRRYAAEFRPEDLVDGLAVEVN